jgi:DNA-binding response OmpR family regulator
MAYILVADDEAAIRAVIRRRLEAAGFEVDEAEDGAVAEHKVGLRPPDLLILDITMPRQEGFETLRKIKAEYPAVKFLMMTGGGSRAGVDYLNIARQFGADGTLEKPFSNGELESAVQRCLSPPSA